MDRSAPDRATVVRARLEAVAEARGDVTEAVLERCYAAMPDARSSFEHHGLGDVAGLEGRMASECLFLLLRWAEERPSVMIDQATTVVHHNDVLEIGPRWYMGMIDAALSVVLDDVPATAAGERRMWAEMRGEIAAFIDGLRAEFLRTIDPDPAAGG